MLSTLELAVRDGVVRNGFVPDMELVLRGELMSRSITGEARNPGRISSSARGAVPASRRAHSETSSSQRSVAMQRLTRPIHTALEGEAQAIAMALPTPEARVAFASFQEAKA